MGSAAIPLSAGLVAHSAKAAPWIEPGDVTLRSDIEVLARYGIIPNLTTTWPLPWAQIADGIDAAAGQQLPNYVRFAIDRVRARMPRDGKGFEQHVQGEVRYTNKPSVVRDFSEPNRQKLYGQLSTDLQLSSSTYVKLSMGYEGDRHHGVALPDDTYIAQNIGNWTVYGGYVPRWWGAGWDTSLFLSTNAREMPSFGITRQNPKPFGTKLLSWLGPWTFDFYVAEFNDPRYIENTALINMRFAFSPLKNLEIGLSRVIMTCGSGRPCSASSLLKSFVGASEHPTTGGGAQDLGNQLASIDIRYTHRISKSVGASFYMQLIGEDSTGPIPVKNSRLFGTSFDGPLGDSGGRWRITGEYSDSFSSNFVASSHHPYNVIYEHHIYRSGYRYYGRALGDSLDNDSQMISLSGRLWDGDSRMLHAAYRYIKLNKDGSCRPISGTTCAGGVSIDAETIHMLEAGIELPTAVGTLSLDGRLLSDQPNTPGVHDSAAEIELGWKFRI